MTSVRKEHIISTFVSSGHIRHKDAHINPHIQCLCAPAALCFLLLHGLSDAMSLNGFLLLQPIAQQWDFFKTANDQNDSHAAAHVWS